MLPNELLLNVFDDLTESYLMRALLKYQALREPDLNVFQRVGDLVVPEGS